MLTDDVQDKDQGNLRWQAIDWKDVTKTVSQLQSRIVKAEKEDNSDKAQRLRSLLLHSLAQSNDEAETGGFVEEPLMEA